uniref:Uncharacterized protein n=1 Tax=Hucho hucho TaxID=62062 RepID=A0A4W5LQQ3_9TELE
FCNLSEGDQCVDESFCTSSLQEYHAQLVSLPNRLNERSMAAWSYVDKIDLNRVPQVLNTTPSLDTVPITLRMPPINIACICATSRQS